MQHVGFNIWAREIWVQYWFAYKMARDRSTAKRCLAALSLIEMFKEEDDRLTKEDRLDTGQSEGEKRDILTIQLQPKD